MGEELGSRAVPCEHSADVATRKDYKASGASEGFRKTLPSGASVYVGRIPDEKVAPIVVVFDNPINTEPKLGFSLTPDAAVALLNLLDDVLAPKNGGWHRVLRYIVEIKDGGSSQSEDGSTPQIPSQPNGEADV